MTDIIVQAVEGATVYDHNSREIPQDRHVRVRKTPHIVQALLDGSLKEFEQKSTAKRSEKKEG